MLLIDRSTDDEQGRRGEAAAVAEGVDRVEQGEPVPDGHRGASRRARLLPPLPHPAPCPGRHRAVARLHHLRDLVRHLLDPGPVPQVVPHRPRDVPGPPHPPVREGRGAVAAVGGGPLREHGGPAQGAAAGDRQHRALHPRRRLPRRQGLLLRLRRRRVHAHLRGAVGDGRVRAQVGAVLQEVQHRATRARVLLLAQGRLPQGQGAAYLRAGAPRHEGSTSQIHSIPCVSLNMQEPLYHAG